MAKAYRRRKSYKYRELMVRIGRELSGLPTLLPRAPFYMDKNERELNDTIVSPYYQAIAKARGIILFETNITVKELERSGRRSGGRT